MKYFITILILFIAGVSLAQNSPGKYGWVPTGKVQIWAVTIIWDTVGYPEEKGYVEKIERKYVPRPGDPTASVIRPTDWTKHGKVYDANMKEVEGVYSIRGEHPKTKKFYQQ